MKKGFTLIEIIVVIAVISLITGMSLAYYNTFNEQQKLRSEAKKIIDVIELAKHKASSGDSPASCTTGFTGYRADIGAASYFISACCAGTCDTANPVQTYPFSSNSITATNGYIQFKQLTGGISTNYSPLQINVKSSQLPANANCIVITFTAVGNISVSSTLTGC